LVFKHHLHSRGWDSDEMESRVYCHETSLQRRILLVLLAISLIGTASSAAEEAEIIVVVNQENPISELSLSDLRHILRADRKRWQSGDAIEILLPPRGSLAMDAIVANVFNMGSVSELGQYYMAAIYQQKITEAPPTTSTDGAIRIVATSKNALAVVPRSGTIGKSGIKIITVDGL